jgi:hypothetical protein
MSGERVIPENRGLDADAPTLFRSGGRAEALLFVRQ